MISYLYRQNKGRGKKSLWRDMNPQPSVWASKSREEKDNLDHSARNDHDTREKN